MRCKALKPTSDSRLQDFLGTLQSFEAYLRFQPALIFPLAASRQPRRALTIRYKDSSVDSNIPETSLDVKGLGQASIHPTEAHSFVASKYCKWRKGSRPRKGSRSVAWLDGMVEILVSLRKALEPTSYPRLQDFLDALQSFEAYLRFQATGFSGYVAKL